MRFVSAIAACAAFALVAACDEPAAAPSTPADAPADSAEIERLTHDAYVEAINSNDVDRLMEGLTDDVVYQYPGQPEIVGKPAVRDWVKGYFDAYSTRWEKTSEGFTVAGDHAFERYTYTSTDTDKTTGEVVTDTGKGINVFRRDADGAWRVAIDGWSSNANPNGSD